MKQKSLVPGLKLQQKWSVTAAALSAVFGIESDPTSYTHLCCPNPLINLHLATEAVCVCELPATLTE